MDDVPAADIAEWVAFEREFGPITVHERIDVAAAIIASAVAATVPRKRGARVPSLSDFLPKWGVHDDAPRQSPEDIMSIASLLVNRARSRSGN